MDWTLDELLHHFESIPTSSSTTSTGSKVSPPTPPPPAQPPTTCDEQNDYIEELNKLLSSQPQQDVETEEQNAEITSADNEGADPPSHQPTEELRPLLLPPPDEEVQLGAFDVSPGGITPVLPPPDEYRDSDAKEEQESFRVTEATEEMYPSAKLEPPMASHADSFQLSWSASGKSGTQSGATPPLARTCDVRVLSVERVWNNNDQGVSDWKLGLPDDPLATGRSQENSKGGRQWQHQPVDGGVGDCNGSKSIVQTSSLQPFPPHIRSSMLISPSLAPPVPPIPHFTLPSSAITPSAPLTPACSSASSVITNGDIDSGIESVDSLSPPGADLSPVSSPATTAVPLSVISAPPATTLEYKNHQSSYSPSAKPKPISVLSSLLSQEPEPTKSRSLLTTLLNNGCTIPSSSPVVPIPESHGATTRSSLDCSSPEESDDADSMKVIAINPNEMTLSKAGHATDGNLHHQQQQQSDVGDFLEPNLPIRSALEDIDKTVSRPASRKRPAPTSNEGTPLKGKNK